MSTIKRPSVSDNPSLHYLYVIGGIAVGVGIITAIIAGAASVSDNPLSGTASVNTVALTIQTLGYGLSSAGLLAIVGGAVAQAINWQITNPRDDSQAKSYREYKAEHD
ncbi:hypothetical protein [Leifsonia sp. Leaf336]|uniref:hypothetical protein n=1 Tax=Leifsonia sp. Leaf336 TaxID=1736341 RepID=UPI000A52CF23|nr:hypothetical protein [Leifsonia sp. Leaf336]